MTKRIGYILIMFLSVCLIACDCAPKDNSASFVKTNGRTFEIDGKPYYFIGTNFWYGAILGSKGEGGNRGRLLKELDYMDSLGINNLRILVGADGPDGTPTKVMPTLQKEPGVYNEEIFDGLDFLLSEMGKRKMYAVLYFTNSWEWSGGYSQYLNWTGHGKIPIPSIDGWDTYIEYVKQYAGSEECTQLLKNHITAVISRTNAYTGQKYTNDPAIMSWQICNEPHAFSDENKDMFEAWMKDVAAHIRSLDPNHLISSGSEGIAGSEHDADLFERIHTQSEIDYFTMHVWPLNWGWMQSDDMDGTMQASLDKTNEYLDKHFEMARKHNMPVVLEEFGLPRDGRKYDLNVPTTLRDVYFKNVFDQVVKHAQTGDVFAGCNFWAWGGFARPTPGHVYWQKGDDYMGDPAQEEQGLNAVFDIDTAIPLIQESISKLNN